MRRSISSFIAVAGLSLGLGQAALAADMSMKAAPVPVAMAPIPTWTGCYLGGNIGGVWGNRDVSVNGITANSGNSDGRFAIGGQFGCDYQTGPVVFGIRNLTDWANTDRTALIPVGIPGILAPGLAGSAINVKNNWVDLLTGRIGFTATPAWLLYFQGGAAWRNTNVTLSAPAVPFYGSTSNTRTGWTVGLGTEYKFAPNWSTFLEYNYATWGSNTATFVTPAGTFGASTKTNVSMILAGVNWRFNW